VNSGIRSIIFAAAVVTVSLASGSAAGAAGALTGPPSGHGWGTATEVPGTAALNKGGNAVLNSVSCGSAGNCSAGGQYRGSSGNYQAFVVSQVHGAWGTAIEVPGTAALNRGGDAEIFSVSCASAGNCSAGGFYADSSGKVQVFVVSQVNGAWGTAIEVPGSAALNQHGFAAIESVSCASAGNCGAGGIYIDSAGNTQAFVVSQAHGTWGKAIEVPGTAALNQGGNAFLSSVSCASAGNCGAGGDYIDSAGNTQAFVVSQAHGAWGKAIEVPGTAALNQGGNGRINAVSCASAGNCSAGGAYYDGSGSQQALVVSQAHGAWGKAIEVPGTAALNQGGGAGISSMSCTSAGNCGAGGFYIDSSGHFQVFVVSEASGAWGKAIEVPGTAALNRGGFAEIFSVSCASAGNCGAGGDYLDSSGHQQALVVSQAAGAWGKAIEVPGTAVLNQRGFAAIESVSCASAGVCSAGGYYKDGSGHSQAFVDSTT
jgi:hypothetical protein